MNVRTPGRHSAKPARVSVMLAGECVGFGLLHHYDLTIVKVTIVKIKKRLYVGLLLDGLDNIEGY